jgi:hypothetical protein
MGFISTQIQAKSIANTPRSEMAQAVTVVDEHKLTWCSIQNHATPAQAFSKVEKVHGIGTMAHHNDGLGLPLLKVGVPATRPLRASHLPSHQVHTNQPLTLS